MKKITSLKVGSHNYQVAYKPLVDKQRVIGLCWHASKRIDIEKSLRPKILAQTLLHEVMHAIYYEYGLINSEMHDADYAAGMVCEEAAVNGLGIGLIQVFSDNPQFKSLIMRACK